MTNPAQPSIFILRNTLRAPAFAVALLCALTIVTTKPTQAQTYSILHNFTGGADGGKLLTAGVMLDRAGNLYGTTSENSDGGPGAVYKLTPRNGSWTFARLYNVGSFGGLTIGPNGSLYGLNNNDAVFNLQPPPHFSPNLLAPVDRNYALFTPSAGSYADAVLLIVRVASMARPTRAARTAWAACSSYHLRMEAGPRP